MSTLSAHSKILTDTQLRVTSSAAAVLGAAQSKGTATDLLLTILASPDGATAVAGTTTPVVQGSNVTASASSNWSNVVADKGTIAAITASGAQNLHFAQLAFQYYRLNLSGTTTLTADVSAVWNFMPVQDSFDTTVQ